MILYTIATAAGRCGRNMKPILSVGMDFYVRVFVEIHDDKNSVRDLSLKTGMVYQSTQCPSFYTLPLGHMGGKSNTTYQPNRVPTGVCAETGAPLKVAGPIWLGPLHDQEVLQTALQRLDDEPNTRKDFYSHPQTSPASKQSSISTPKMEHIATRERLRGLLTSCLEEIPNAPLYYKLDEIARCIHMSMPPLLEFKSALINAGYRVSGHHKEPLAVKTDAPCSIVWDIVRAWVKRRPLGKPSLQGSVAEKILSVPPTIEVNFNRPRLIHETKEMHARVKRFPMNPERDWGPKAKASHGVKRKTPEE
jgi:tRNA (guanine26-N2/guanine27-N2)-dimethyltransferase